ncbi:hypothetical protein CB0940_09331 [Cercospora beticola]|uniref:Uncharacterized protein n=1 Tax=Cercospora beticola TaxID=122368 RepID=A0A2G5HI66_CERBT|nr:hypothetical protein CB0940_09331 [Cercospora beticola]PIA92276.1 hypothetical protein CB0940_09331 [Cercospora beticola]WPB06353.1 hypothetical protein RHO25_011010 [Cercospora beticola]
MHLHVLATVWLITLTAVSASPENVLEERNYCNKDACLRAVSKARTAKADCSSFLQPTVTPCPVTVCKTITKTTACKTSTITKPCTVTATRTAKETTVVTDIITEPVTITTVTTSTTTTTTVTTITGIPLLEKRELEERNGCKATTRRATKTPQCAATCKNKDAYSSACSCLGVRVPKATTVKAKTVTTTKTVFTTSTPVITVPAKPCVTKKATVAEIKTEVDTKTITSPVATETKIITETITETSTFTEPPTPCTKYYVSVLANAWWQLSTDIASSIPGIDLTPDRDEASTFVLSPITPDSPSPFEIRTSDGDEPVGIFRNPNNQNEVAPLGVRPDVLRSLNCERDDLNQLSCIENGSEPELITQVCYVGDGREQVFGGFSRQDSPEGVECEWLSISLEEACGVPPLG